MKHLLSLKQFQKNQKGSFTIEASLVFPIIFFCILVFVYLSLYVYEVATLYARASIAADRIAANWDNSHKDPISGAFSVYSTDDNGDGLYWRISEAFGNKTYEIGSGAGNLTEKKFHKQVAESNLLKNVKGEIKLEYGLQRTVTVTLKKSVNMPSLPFFDVGLDDIKVSGKAKITEPVEFIRTFDMLVYYTWKITEGLVK